MDKKTVFDKKKLTQRMVNTVGAEFLTSEEIDSLYKDIVRISEIFNEAFGLKIVVTDKPVKPTFTINEHFLQAGIEQELRAAGYLSED